MVYLIVAGVGIVITLAGFGIIMWLDSTDVREP